MGILPFKCGIDGCKKSKLQKHTHTVGDLGLSRSTIEQYRVFAQMRGEALSIPGGSADDMAHYMTNQVRENSKEAKKFREKLAKEVKRKAR
jgi:hypothetical protein